MQIRNIELRNLKCFGAQAKIDFTLGRADGSPHRWIVIYGDNGHGKSSLLRAIGIATTGQVNLNRLLPSAEGWVRSTNRFAEIRAQITKSDRDTSIGFPRSRPIDSRWTLVGRRSTRLDNKFWPSASIFQRDGSTKHEKDDVKLLRTQIALDDPGRGWLVCGYGTHRRLTGAASDISETIPSDSRASRLVTLFHEKAALTSAERWIKDLHYAASLEAAGGAKQKRYESVREMINHGLMREGVTLSSVSPDGVFFSTPYSKSVPIADLSDGYRTMLALTLDLLRHVSHCFELSEVLDTTGPHAKIVAEGVVLIDELDSHLHPSWQRTIGSWLHSRFPHIQFIVATHSPMIASRVSADHGMVVRLTKRRQGRSHVILADHALGQIGLTADQVLTGPNFGLATTRDVLIEELLGEIRRLQLRVRRREATPAQRQELRALQLSFNGMAPAGLTFSAARNYARYERELAHHAVELDQGQANKQR